MSSSLKYSSRFTSVLEASYALIPSLLVGEVWMQSTEPVGFISRSESTIASASAKPNAFFNDLVAFYTPSPLLASFPLDSTEGSSSTVMISPERPVDLSVARQYSTLHGLSLSLAAEAAASGKPTWAKELSGDELLMRLTFKVEEVLAIPVLVKKTRKETYECNAVMILFLSSQSKNEDVSSHLLYCNINFCIFLSFLTFHIIFLFRSLSLSLSTLITAPSSC